MVTSPSPVQKLLGESLHLLGGEKVSGKENASARALGGAEELHMTALSQHIHLGQVHTADGNRKRTLVVKKPLVEARCVSGNREPTVS